MITTETPEGPGASAISMQTEQSLLPCHIQPAGTGCPQVHISVHIKVKLALVPKQGQGEVVPVQIVALLSL